MSVKTGGGLSGKFMSPSLIQSPMHQGGGLRRRGGMRDRGRGGRGCRGLDQPRGLGDWCKLNMIVKISRHSKSKYIGRIGRIVWARPNETRYQVDLFETEKDTRAAEFFECADLEPFPPRVGHRFEIVKGDDIGFTGVVKDIKDGKACVKMNGGVAVGDVGGYIPLSDLCSYDY